MMGIWGKNIKMEEEYGGEKITGFEGFAVLPLGDGVVDLLAIDGNCSVGILEAVPEEISADVGVGNVREPSCSPGGYCCTRHLPFSALRMNR